MFWADIVLNTEESSEGASATVSCALLAIAFFPRFWRVNPLNFLTAAMLKCAGSEMREHQNAKSSAAISFGNTFGSKV